MPIRDTCLREMHAYIYARERCVYLEDISIIGAILVCILLSQVYISQAYITQAYIS
jgi:hypothetical protein